MKLLEIDWSGDCGTIHSCECGFNDTTSTAEQRLDRCLTGCSHYGGMRDASGGLAHPSVKMEDGTRLNTYIGCHHPAHEKPKVQPCSTREDARLFGWTFRKLGNCPTCGGRGEGAFMSTAIGATASKGWPKVTCPACNGSGKK